MKFTKTYNATSYSKYYYYIDNKRVSENEYYYQESLARQKNKSYNCSSLVYDNKKDRYISVFHYD